MASELSALDARTAFADPLLEEAAPRRVCCNARVVELLCVVVVLGLTMQLCSVVSLYGRSKQHLVVEEPAIVQTSFHSLRHVPGAASRSRLSPLRLGSRDVLGDYRDKVLGHLEHPVVLSSLQAETMIKPLTTQAPALSLDATTQSPALEVIRETDLEMLPDDEEFAELPFMVGPFKAGPLSEFVVTSAGVRIPRLIYRSVGFVDVAMASGLKGLDTHIERKYHYDKTGRSIGSRLEVLFKAGLERDLYVQGHFQTSCSSEADDSLTSITSDVKSTNLPSAPQAQIAAERSPDLPLAEQVRLSIEELLSTLGVKQLNTLLLDELCPDHKETMEVWRAMEDAVQAGLVLQLGISQIETQEQLLQLEQVYEDATVKPAIVHQLFYAETDIERELRLFCIVTGIYLQTYTTLTSDRSLMRNTDVVAIAKNYDVTPTALILRFLMGLGLIPLASSYSPEELKSQVHSCYIPLKLDDALKIDEAIKNSL